MAEVYLARQAGGGIREVVCLKRILPHLGARQAVRGDVPQRGADRRPASIHPNIVSIFDLGEANGKLLIAMEFIDGPSLRAAGKRAVGARRAAAIPEIVRIVCMGRLRLHYAHDLAAGRKAAGARPRDIRPTTSSCTETGGEGGGLSASPRPPLGRLTRTAPSRARSRTCRRSSSAGIRWIAAPTCSRSAWCSTRCFAGQRPVAGDSEVSLIGKIMTEDPQPLAKLRPDAPAGSPP